MSAHSDRYPRRVNPLAACRQALQRGPLTLNGNHFSFGDRKFHPGTVRKLIAYGEAVRVGRHVVAWRPQ